MHVVNHIDARGATDPHGIAREIQLALERSTVNHDGAERAGMKGRR